MERVSHYHNSFEFHPFAAIKGILPKREKQPGIEDVNPSSVASAALRLATSNEVRMHAGKPVVSPFDVLREIGIGESKLREDFRIPQKTLSLMEHTKGLSFAPIMNGELKQATIVFEVDPIVLGEEIQASKKK